MKWCVWLAALLAAGAGAQLPPGPEPFVELDPAGDYVLSQETLRGGTAESWALPVLLERATGERVFDWAWRSRSPRGIHPLPSILPAPSIHSLICYDYAKPLLQAMDGQSRVWVVHGGGMGNECWVALARFRSPFAPRPVVVPSDLPSPDPRIAEEFRRQLRSLTQVRAGGSPLLSLEAVQGLDRFELGPGEPDFPTPLETRLAAAKEVWRLGAEMLNEAMARWQNPPFITSYGCLYASEQRIHGFNPWRDVVLPPQVQQRIARLKEMPETDDRKLLRWQTNRLLLDYLVPCVGVACYVPRVWVKTALLSPDLSWPWLFLQGQPLELSVGRDHEGKAFDGVSLWYGQAQRGTCVMAVRGDGQCAYQLKGPAAEK